MLALYRRAGQPDIDDYIFNGSSAFGDGRGGISAFKVKAGSAAD